MSTTLRPKPEQDIARKENYKPVFMVNIDIILNKIFGG
jgi:hypothetical protein